MSAFNAFKAKFRCVEPQSVHNAGEGHSGHQEAPPAHVRGPAPHQVQPHRHALEYAYRQGMIQQVKRLVVVQTEEMYNARKQKDANHKALRPPLVVHHQPAPAPATDSSST